MKAEKLTEKQTHNTYEIEIGLIEDNGTMYGGIYGSLVQDHFTGNFRSRVKLFLRGRLLEDTKEQNNVKLDDLISKVLKDHNIKIDK